MIKNWPSRGSQLPLCYYVLLVCPYLAEATSNCSHLFPSTFRPIHFTIPSISITLYHTGLFPSSTLITSSSSPSLLTYASATSAGPASVPKALKSASLNPPLNVVNTANAIPPTPSGTGTVPLPSPVFATSSNIGAPT